jgi:hypothetical protein
MASEMTWIFFFRSTHAALPLMVLEVLELLVACTGGFAALPKTHDIKN